MSEIQKFRPEGLERKLPSGVGRDPLIRRRRDLMEATLGYEILALDSGNGICLGFNETAACVWRVLEQPSTVSGLLKVLVSDFDIEEDYCKDRLIDLLSDLESKKLIEVTY